MPMINRYLFILVVLLGGFPFISARGTSSTQVDTEKNDVAALSTPSATGETSPASSSPFIKDGVLDLDAAVNHFENLYRSTSSIAVAELKIIKPKWSRTLTMKAWSEGTKKALIIIQSPPREKGTATLKVDKNLWNFLPRIKRTIRIPPSMMLASWMGSDFTNDDLVRESSFKEDYFYKLIGPSENPKGWLVRFTAKPDQVGLWDHLDLVVSPDGSLPVLARYYDRKGQLARTMYWDDIKEFDGKRLPAHMTIIPEGEKGQRTEMTYLSIDFDVPIPESMFSLSSLEGTH